ncbi:LuxR C-terminal-related transcriptional regulator [Kribbella sp. CA-294648]|uniref:helix-turn-helix transcriptional regulator n=1 Tax=Kribbella sp. CA-294648 TaxID=3239948 RepID=UPI003D8EE484
MALVDQALTLPADCLDSAVSGLRALSVTGAPGSGKTHLLQNLQSEAVRRGWRTVFVTAGAPDLVERVQRALNASVPTGDPDRGLLLLVDDLQTMEQPVLALIRRLLSEPMDRRVLIAVAYRPLQMLGPDLCAVVDALSPSSHIAMEGLTLEEARTLLAGLAPETEIEELHGLSAGSPRYLIPLGRRAISFRRTGMLPDEVLALARAEFDQLSAKTRDVLSVCAVLGVSFDAELVDTLHRDRSDYTDAALEELCNSYILGRSPEGRLRLVFRRPILRAAAYQLTPARTRKYIHRELVRELVGRGAPPELIAPHCLDASGVDSRTAVEHLVTGAAAVRGQTPLLAADWYGGAARLVLAGADDGGSRSRLHLLQAECLTDGGRFDEAWAAVLSAQRAEPADNSLRGAAMIHTARIERMTGHHDESRALLRRVRRETAGDQRFSSLIELTATELFRCDYAEALATIHEAGKMSVVSAVGGSLATTALESFACCGSGDVVGAGAAVDSFQRHAAEMSDGELAPYACHLFWAAATYSQLGESSRSLAVANRTIRILRSSGLRAFMPQILHTKATQLLSLGRLDEALATAAEGLSVAQAIGDAHSIAGSNESLARILIDVGRSDDGLDAARDAYKVLSEVHSWSGSMASLTLADAYLHVGRADESLELLISATTGSMQLDPDGAGRRLRVLAAAHLAAGNCDAAFAAIAEMREHAQHRLSVVRAHADLAAAESHLTTGAYVAAIEHALVAEKTFQRLGRVLDAVTSQRVVGLGLAGTGKKADALKRLSTAATRARDLGAGRLVTSFDADISEVYGEQLASNRPQNRLGLMTAREWEVAEQVVQGLTNKQIAAQLYLSERTVERHLSRIFTKLNISSRATLAALVGVHSSQASAS